MLNINIINKTHLWNQFKFQLPMIICAMWVISNQRKLIWDTLKSWFSWNWTSERITFLKIFGVGFLTLIISNSLALSFQDKLVKKQKVELIEKMHEEGVINTEKENPQNPQENENNSQPSNKQSVKLPFFNISPLFSFFTIVLVAPIVEECVFRYLIFEIFDKKKPLAYVFSGISFVFFHWQGAANGLLTFATINLLLIYYLPMTIFFIYAYRKGKWNIIYPISFHFLWNLLVFCALLPRKG